MHGDANQQRWFICAILPKFGLSAISFFLLEADVLPLTITISRQQF